MKPIRLRNRNLAHYHHRRLAYIMQRVDWNLSAFTREVAG